MTVTWAPVARVGVQVVTLVRWSGCTWRGRRRASSTSGLWRSHWAGSFLVCYFLCGFSWQCEGSDNGVDRERSGVQSGRGPGTRVLRGGERGEDTEEAIFSGLWWWGCSLSLETSTCRLGSKNSTQVCALRLRRRGRGKLRSRGLKRVNVNCVDSSLSFTESVTDVGRRWSEGMVACAKCSA